MAALTIQNGLRKLEFISFGDDAETSEARVEFARESPLPEGERVYISLGMRAGSCVRSSACRFSRAVDLRRRIPSIGIACKGRDHRAFRLTYSLMMRT